MSSLFMFKRKHKLSENSGVGRKRVLKRTDPQCLPQAEQTNFPGKSSFSELKEILVANSADKVYLHHPFINLYYFV